MVDEMDVKVKTLNTVGERAYFPGTWRHDITVEQVLATRREPLREEDEMSGKSRLKWRRKVERAVNKQASKDKKGRVWCVNVSGKRQQITIPGGGKPIMVEPDGRVELKHVKTDHGIYEGFAYDTRVTTPPLKQVLKTPPTQPKDVEYEKVVEPSLKSRRKLIPVPKTKKRIAKPAELPTKSPVDAPKHQIGGKEIRRCGCGKPLSPGNKSGKCRDCYFASFRKKK